MMQSTHARLVAPFTLSILSILLLAAPLYANAATYYVATTGSDSSSCGASASPCRTITYAYDNKVAAGDTLMVQPGTYTDFTSGYGIRIYKTGTASAPITIKSVVKGGAILDGQYNSNKPEVMYFENASYNTVDGFKMINAYRAGVFMFGNTHITFSNNEITNGSCSTQVTGSGIYEDQTNSYNTFAGNYIHDNGKSSCNTYAHGMYLSGDYQTVYNNIINHNVYGNGIQVAGYGGVSNLHIYNNTITNSGQRGIVLWPAKEDGGTTIDNTLIYNNIIAFNATDGIGGCNSTGSGGTGNIVSNNVIYGNARSSINWDSCGTGNFGATVSNTIASNPLFVNNSSDLHLQSTSPAINAGINDGVTTDFAGTARPQGSAYDIGAYEYVSSVPAPTATLTANPTSITSGGSATLTWSSTNATSCTGTGFTASGTGGSTSVFPTVTTTYSITCTGTGGSASASATITVTSAFNYALSNSGTIVATQGSSGSNTVTATLSAGVAQAVSFSASGIPSGASASFSSTSCNPTCTTTLTITTGAGTPAGNSTITVTGSLLAKTTTFTLTVNSAGSINPVGIWKLDETSGTAASDSSGNGNNGTLSGSPVPAWVIGRINGALSLQSGGYVNIPDNATLDFGTGSFSYGGWINLTTGATSGWEIPLSKLASGTGGYDIEYGPGYSWTACIGDGVSTACTGVSDTTNYMNGTWHHVFVVANRATQTLSVYVDGVLTHSIGISGVGNVSSANPLLFGSVSSPLVGSIDDMRIYNRALSATEVLALYNSAPVIDITPPSTPTNLAGTAISSTQINLTWTASTDNIAVTGYRILRDGVQIGTSATNSFSSTGLAASTVYSYTVSAYDAAGNNSQPSVSLSAITLASTAQAIVMGSRVVTTANLNVRASASPSATKVGTEVLSALGTVIGGSTTANGYLWWQVNWDNALSGWSIADYLVVPAAASSPAVGMNTPSRFAFVQPTSTNASLIQQLMQQVQDIMQKIQTLQAQTAGAGTNF